VPHAGLGFERTLAYVTGLANVRDAIPFPRTPGTRGIDATALAFASGGYSTLLGSSAQQKSKAILCPRRSPIRSLPTFRTARARSELPLSASRLKLER
jgi:hypothetical protein